MTVYNLKSLNGNPVANQIVVENDDVSTFFSYGTFIASIDRNDGVINIGSAYNYSRTTSRYRNIFFDSKNCKEINNLIDLRNAIKTGEVTIGETPFKVNYIK